MQEIIYATENHFLARFCRTSSNSLIIRIVN